MLKGVVTLFNLLLQQPLVGFNCHGPYAPIFWLHWVCSAYKVKFQRLRGLQ